MNARRRFLVAFGATTLAMSRYAYSQQAPARIPRIGILLFNSPQHESLAPLLEGLQALGYVDGKTISIEYRQAEGNFERLAALATELVQLKPDLIFALGGATLRHMPREQRRRSRSWQWSATIPCRPVSFKASGGPVAT
jgi:ABC-type uncharacterized transport system substrate-binding protein